MLSEFPLDAWAEYLPNLQKFFHTLKAFQQAYSEFSLASVQLQALINPTIRQVNNTKGVGAPVDHQLHTFFLGRILGIENNELKIWIGTGLRSESELVSYEERYKLILENAAVEEMIPLYQSTYENLEKGLDGLRVALAEPMVPKRNRKRLFKFK